MRTSFNLKLLLTAFACLLTVSTALPLTFSDVPVRGRQMKVNYRGSHSKGELIAVSADTIYLSNNLRLLRLSKAYVSRIIVREDGPTGGGIFGWTLLGTISTPSHGLGLVLTAPAWLLIGTTTAIIVAFTNDYELPRDRWDRLNEMARFPQGLPPDFAYPKISGIKQAGS